jgi:hypothetical protein
MFTYLPNDNPQLVQESDIEILTAGPRDMVQYTNQPSNDKNGNAQPQATVNGTNPGGRDWTLWNTYRLDWMPKMTSWYVKWGERSEHRIPGAAESKRVDNEYVERWRCLDGEYESL